MRRVGSLFVLGSWLAACSPPVEAPRAADPVPCVDEFDPAVDYFPDKATPRFAERFSVEYFSHYKLVTVTLLDGETSFRYLLLQCGTPRPEGFDNVDVVEIPVRTVVTTSTTELPHFVQLGLVDRLVGHVELDYVGSPEIRQRIEEGGIIEVGHEIRINMEILIDLAPELVMSSLGSFERDVFGRVRQAGVPVVQVPSFLEARPLGQAEWILFTAFFFNREALAARTFEAVAERYRELAERGRSATARPTVFSGAPIGDTWYVPGGRSFLALFIEDAGGRYLWSDLRKAGTVPLAVESVYERAVDADYWIHPGLWTTLEEISGADERFATLAAFSSRRVYQNDARMNQVGKQGVGGNDYWETGTLRPDLVLADLLRIFHPELMSEHELVYHRQL